MLVIRMGPTEKGTLCIICCSEIMPSEPCALHFECELGSSFHLDCLDTYLRDNPSAKCPECDEECTEIQPDAPQKSHPPFSPPTTPGQPDTHKQKVHPELENVWEASDPFTELKPEIPYLQCTFQSPKGLIELISSGQASIETLTGQEVWDLHLSPTDKKEALRLSSTLDGFSRIFYHVPGQPRDGSTLILTHPKVSEPYPGLRSSSDASNPSVPKAELDDLANMIDTIRRANNDAASKAGQWVSPPTTCATVKVNGRKAKIVTGMVWLKPGEDGDDRVKRRR